MKKYWSIILSLLLMLSFSAIFTSCKSNSNIETDTQNPDIYTDNYEETEINILNKIKDSFPFPTAITDENGDTYYITLNKLNKISGETGEITMIDGAFEYQYGHSLALHNDYIYYAFGDSLYRINKNGTEKHQYNDGNSYGDFVAVVDNDLYVNVYNEETKRMEYYTANINGEPNNLSLICINYDNDKYFCTDEVKVKLLEYSKVIIPEIDPIMDSMDGTQPQYPINYFSATEKYLYYIKAKDGQKSVGRINIETMETETVPIYSYGLIPPTVTEGWIYYTDKDAETYRMSEDLTKIENLS